MNKEQIVEAIFETLQGQRFANWYGDGGKFDNWIRGEVNRPTAEQIKEDIARLFHVDKQ